MSYAINSEREPQPSEVEGTPLRSGEFDQKDKGRKRSRVNLVRAGESGCDRTAKTNLRNTSGEEGLHSN